MISMFDAPTHVFQYMNISFRPKYPFSLYSSLTPLGFRTGTLLFKVAVCVTVTVFRTFSTSTSVIVFVMLTLQKSEVCVVVVSTISSFVFVTLQVTFDSRVLGRIVLVMVRFEPGTVDVMVRFEVRSAVEAAIVSVVVTVKFCPKRGVCVAVMVV